MDQLLYRADVRLFRVHTSGLVLYDAIREPVAARFEGRAVVAHHVCWFVVHWLDHFSNRIHAVLGVPRHHQ